jgi:alcohol dehydrogenase
MNFSSFRMTAYTLGHGSLESLGELPDGRIALVVDRQILAALKLDAKLESILAGKNHEIICDMPQEPTRELLAEPIKRVKAYAPTHIVAIGGGSVMDAAKALWLFYELPHYDWEAACRPFAVEKFPGKAQLIAVPTTSGTGSDTTNCSVVKDEQKRKKMILSPEIIPTRAILDFDLLKSLPPRNIAYSGADALAHAFEAGVTVATNPMVKMVCREVCVTLINNLASSFEGSEAARAEVHVAASLAGAGIGNSITGMAHGMDFAGGDFNLAHGLVTGMLLPYTMLYLIPNPFYADVADRLGIPGTNEAKQRELVEKIIALYGRIKLPRTLKEVGVDEEAYLDKIPSYIERAKVDANVTCAPKQPSDPELKALFKQFYYGIQ